MVAYGNDGHQGEGLPTGVFLDSTIVRILGYMVPVLLFTCLQTIIGRRSVRLLGLLPIFQMLTWSILHPYAGKAENDQTYAEANAGPVWENDERAFNEYVQLFLANDVERLNE